MVVFVVLIGLAWAVVVQFAMGPISRTTTFDRAAALVVTALFWVGPASWLWCGIAIFTGSAVVASIVAVVGGYVGMLLGVRVTAAGRVRAD